MRSLDTVAFYVTKIRPTTFFTTSTDMVWFQLKINYVTVDDNVFWLTKFNALYAKTAVIGRYLPHTARYRLWYSYYLYFIYPPCSIALPPPLCSSFRLDSPPFIQSFDLSTCDRGTVRIHRVPDLIRRLSFVNFYDCV